MEEMATLELATITISGSPVHDRLQNRGVRSHPNPRPNEHCMLGLARTMMCKYIWKTENLEDSGGWGAKRTAYVNMQGLIHLWIGMKAKLQE